MSKQLPIFGITAGELVVMGIVALLVLTGINDQTGSDPRASLLVSESILTHGTIRLDHYGKTLLDSYGYVIHYKGGHYYYYFPLGTSLFSVPLVAALRLTGASIASIEPAAQVLIAALAACVNVLLLIKIGKLFLGGYTSIIVALLFWLGSSLSSTKETLENPSHPSENIRVSAGADWVHGQQAARIR